MDMQRKKQLLLEYKSRKPEMGIISFRCVETKETFLDISRDTKVDRNSNRFKLAANRHPDKRLQELWDHCGDTGFEVSVIRVLKYEDPAADHTRELEKLLTQCLDSNGDARRIGRCTKKL